MLRRRVVRCSMLGVFAVISIVCAVVAHFASTVRKEEECVRALVSLRAVVTYDFQEAGHAAAQTPLLAREAVGASYFSTVVRVDLSGRTIDDSCLVHLDGLRNLKTLVVYGTAVTDQGLQHISTLKTLEKVSLYGYNFTDEGIAHFRRLTRLKELQLFHTQVSDQGVDKLRRAVPNCGIHRQ